MVVSACLAAHVAAFSFVLGGIADSGDPARVTLDIRVIQLGAGRDFPGERREGPALTVVDGVMDPGGVPYSSGTLSVVQDFDADRAVSFDEQGNPTVMSDRTFIGSVPVYTLRAAMGAIRLQGAEYVIARDWTPGPNDPPPSGRFFTLLAPRAIAESGQGVILRVASDVQWMELNPDGSFSVKSGNEETEGITISLTPRAEGTAVRTDDLTIEFREVARREPVKGVNLAIGRPVFRSSLVRASAAWANDHIVVVPLQPLTEHSGTVFVLIRAEIAP